jgi:hypothetical protein
VTAAGGIGVQPQEREQPAAIEPCLLECGGVAGDNPFRPTAELDGCPGRGYPWARLIAAWTCRTGIHLRRRLDTGLTYGVQPRLRVRSLQ